MVERRTLDGNAVQLFGITFVLFAIYKANTGATSPLTEIIAFSGVIVVLIGLLFEVYPVELSFQ